MLDTCRRWFAILSSPCHTHFVITVSFELVIRVEPTSGEARFRAPKPHSAEACFVQDHVISASWIYELAMLCSSSAQGILFLPSSCVCKLWCFNYHVWCYDAVQYLILYCFPICEQLNFLSVFFFFKSVSVVVIALLLWKETLSTVLPAIPFFILCLTLNFNSMLWH